MKELLNFPLARLKRLVALKEQIDKLQSQVETLVMEVSPGPVRKIFQKKHTVSAATRKKLSDIAKARWVKIKARKS